MNTVATVVVVAIIAIPFVLGLKKIYKSIFSKGGGCGCGHSDGDCCSGEGLHHAKHGAKGHNDEHGESCCCCHKEKHEHDGAKTESAANEASANAANAEHEAQAEGKAPCCCQHKEA